jgi:uncharacterized protein (DUF2126 family)
LACAWRRTVEYRNPRFVDSSLERLQVKVSGIVPDRHILLCKGCRIPLRSTGTKGEYVAGIRYKSLESTIRFTPKYWDRRTVSFDLVDTWNKSHWRLYILCQSSRGRSFDTYPINSFEAESRKDEPFWDFGHTPASSIEAIGTEAIQSSCDLSIFSRI